MKDHLRDIVNENFSKEVNVNRLREYLQEYLLYILYRRKIYKELVFCGGTALRFLYKIRRFSEDLDFSLSEQLSSCDFEQILKIIKDEFELAGYQLEIKYNTDKNVYSAFLKFPGLLFEYGLSSLRDEKLSIKMEIDVNPPRGGIEEVTVCNRAVMFYLQHYNRASLFAGKLHALLCRKYTKGRDWYDLLWYLTKFKNLEPNFKMLNNALRQTDTNADEINKETLKVLLKLKIDELDIKKVYNDVYRFLEVPEEKALLTRENFHKEVIAF